MNPSTCQHCDAPRLPNVSTCDRHTNPIHRPGGQYGIDRRSGDGPRRSADRDLLKLITQHEADRATWNARGRTEFSYEGNAD